MPDRFRFYSLVLGGWLLAAVPCGDALAQNTEQTATPLQAVETDSGQAEDFNELLMSLKGIEAAIRTQPTTEDTEASNRRELREEAGLAAQQEMASWARPMFLAAVVSVAFTGIGILLIWRTLHHTRRAADAAFDAAKQAENAAVAAFESVEITKTSSTTQLRAYLTIDSVTSQTLVTLDDILQQISSNKVTIQIKNTGMSPAKSINFSAYLSVLNIISGEKDCFCSTNNNRGDIGGGGIIKEVMPTLDYTIKIDENHDLLLEGVIKYKDVFDSERLTEFSYHYIKENGFFNDGPIWSPTEKGNNLT